MSKLSKLTKNILLSFIVALSMMGFVSDVDAFASSIDPGNIKEIRTKEGLGITDESVLASEGDGSWYLYYSKDNQFLPYKKYGDNAAVFCTMFGSVSPASNNYLVDSKGKNPASKCVLDTSWDEATKAGVAAIIDEVTTNNSNPFFSGNSLKNYYNAEIAINKFLYGIDNNKCHLSNTDCTGSGIDAGTDKWKINSNSPSEITSLVVIADDTYTKIKSGNTEIKVSTPEAGFQLGIDDEHGSAYVLGHIISYIGSSDVMVSDPEQYSIKIKDSKGNQVYKDYAFVVEGNNNLPKAIICNNNTKGVCKGIDDFKEIAVGEYTVEITINTQEKYNVAENYICTGDSDVKYQSITLAYTESKSRPVTDTIELGLTVKEKSPELELIINKKSSDGKGLKGALMVVVGVGFEFEGKYPMDSDSIVIDDLPEYGTYEIIEFKAPSGYVLDTTPKKVTFNANNKSQTVTFVNEPDLENEVYPGLIIKKIDETGKGISGATIKITGVDVKFEKTYNMDSSVKGIDYLKEFGTYKIQEVKAPDGYVLNNQVIEVTLTKKEPNDIIELVNVKEVVNSANLLVKKVNNKGDYVSGATLRLVDEEGQTIKEWKSSTTDEKFINLPLGTYTIEEVKAPNGYALNEKKETIKLTENGKNYTVNFVNAELVKVPDTLSNFSKLITIAGLTGLLAGLGLLYFNKRKQEQ